MKLPHFSLRELFWLVLVCGLAVGWWVRSTQLNAAKAELEATRAELVKAQSENRKLLPAAKLVLDQLHTINKNGASASADILEIDGCRVEVSATKLSAMKRS
jgi:hypothetical protein